MYVTQEPKLIQSDLGSRGLEEASVQKPARETAERDGTGV